MPEGVNPKDLIGATKAPLRFVPPILVVEVAPVMALGAAKYGPFNWRQYDVTLSTYVEAAERHLLAMKDGQWFDPESGRPHAAHIAAGMGIVLDALATEHLIVDIPLGGVEGATATALAQQAAG